MLNTKYEYNHGILPSITTTDPRNQEPPEAFLRIKLRSAETQLYIENKRKIPEKCEELQDSKRRRKESEMRQETRNNNNKKN